MSHDTHINQSQHSINVMCYTLINTQQIVDIVRQQQQYNTTTTIQYNTIQQNLRKKWQNLELNCKISA